MDSVQPISFYQMAGIFGTAYVRTSTQDKAINGFKSCGLRPFDDIFRDEDFAAAELTEEARPVVRDIDQVDADVQPVPDNMRHHDQDAHHDDSAVVSMVDALIPAAGGWHVFCKSCTKANMTNIFTKGKSADLPKKDDMRKHL